MGRLILASPIALLVTLALFSLMAWMVDNGGKSIPKPTAALSFTMVMAEQEQDVQRRQRSVPEQPQVPQVPTQAPAKAEQTAALDVSDLNPVMDLNLSTAMEGVAVNAPQFGDFAVNQQVMPLHRVEPNYPAKALQRGVEGYVICVLPSMSWEKRAISKWWMLTRNAILSVRRCWLCVTGNTSLR